MTPDAAIVIHILLGTSAGFAVGLVYFTSVWRSTSLLARGDAVLSVVGWTGLRLVLAVGAFWLIAQWGAAVLLAAAAGLTGARPAVWPTTEDGR